MKFADHLSKEQKQKLIQAPKKKKKRRNKEKLTRDQVEDLMGINRDTYKRGKGGAIRRR